MSKVTLGGFADRAELARSGASWGAAIPTGSAFTYVAAWPTTRAELVLFNDAPVDGKTLVIDRVWMYGVTSMAAAQPVALLGQLVPASAGETAPADNANILRHSLSGKVGSYRGKAKLALANTDFAVANQWFTLGAGLTAPMTTNLGLNTEAHVWGKYLVPPGAVFCMAGVAGTAAGTAIIGVEWHEMQFEVS